METALYRYFDKSDQLLYIGISNCIPRRFDQHSANKPWYHEAARITVEHFASRSEALAAEKIAIKTERPKHNIQHNYTGAPRTVPRGPWVFQSRRSGFERQVDLYLYPEIDCSAMVDEFYGLDGEGQLAAYVEYVDANYPQWLADDAVPIVWLVQSRDASVCEAAPFAPGIYSSDLNFLTSFTWPYHAKTREALDWYRLPVLNLRFPEFAEALGWTPSPLQSTCPLRSILDSRDCIEPARPNARAGVRVA